MPFKLDENVWRDYMLFDSDRCYRNTTNERETMKRAIELSENTLKALARGDWSQEAQIAAKAALEPECLRWYREQNAEVQGVLMTLGAAYVKCNGCTSHSFRANLAGAAVSQWGAIAREYLLQCV